MRDNPLLLEPRVASYSLPYSSERVTDPVYEKNRTNPNPEPIRFAQSATNG